MRTFDFAFFFSSAALRFDSSSLAPGQIAAWKTILLPSGLQTGALAAVGALVTRCASPPPRDVQHVHLRDLVVVAPCREGEALAVAAPRGAALSDPWWP